MVTRPSPLCAMSFVTYGAWPGTPPGRDSLWAGGFWAPRTSRHGAHSHCHVPCDHRAL